MALKFEMEIGALPPPISLSDIYVTVIYGQDITLTHSELVGEFPRYYQQNSMPMATILITSENNNPTTDVLSLNPTIAKISNQGLDVYRENPTTIRNGLVSNSTINGGGFLIQGIAIGRTSVTYRATAIDEGGLESNPSSISGVIHILVTDHENRPPSYILDGGQIVIRGVTNILKARNFVNSYTDPENDPPYKVMIVSLPPVGEMRYNGNIVNAGDEILFSEITAGKLTYHVTNLSVGQVVGFEYTVSDVGSRNYY